MASLIDYEGLTCEYCGAEGSLVPDGDFDVECTSCGATYSLDDYDDYDYLGNTECPSCGCVGHFSVCASDDIVCEECGESFTEDELNDAFFADEDDDESYCDSVPAEEDDFDNGDTECE